MNNPFAVFKKRAIDSKTLQENEYSANKALAFGCAFGSFLMLLIWVFYLIGVFELGMESIMTSSGFSLSMHSRMVSRSVPHSSFS